MKKFALILVLSLVFLCLVSCSSLLEDYLLQTGVFAPVSTAKITLAEASDANAPTLTLPPSADTPTTPTTTRAQNNITVVLDAGHGENDPGAEAYKNGVKYQEKTVNLSVALMLRDELLARGYTVLMIRDSDVSLLHGWDTQGEATARRIYGVDSGADLYVSLHCNSYVGAGGRAWGPIIFYNGRVSYKSYDMVQILQSALSSAFSGFEAMRECRIREDGEYIVLKSASMPSFLVEMGFMSDSSDLTMLLDDAWQREMAKSLADGIDELYKNDYIG